MKDAFINPEMVGLKGFQNPSPEKSSMRMLEPVAGTTGPLLDGYAVEARGYPIGKDLLARWYRRAMELGLTDYTHAKS